MWSSKGKRAGASSSPHTGTRRVLWCGLGCVLLIIILMSASSNCMRALCRHHSTVACRCLPHILFSVLPCSMEEAHELCDRLGIFVDGQLVCIGSPQELTARYAGFYVRLWRMLLDGGGLGSWHCLRSRSNVLGAPQPTKFTLPPMHRCLLS